MIYTKLSGDPFFQLQAVALALLRVVRLGVVVGAAEAGLHGSRGRTLGGGGGRLASCNLVADAAEAIIGDVQPRALFQEEGIAHSLVRTFAVDARSIVAADWYDPDVGCGFTDFTTGDEDKIESFHFLVRF